MEMAVTKDADRPRPYKRKLTEKRRSQNRIAQRAYREKRKKRIELLETAVANSGIRHDSLNREEHSHAAIGFESQSEIENAGGVSSATALGTLDSPPTKSMSEENDARMEAESSFGASLPSKTSTTDKLRAILRLDHDDEATALVEFANTEKLDLNTIIRAGLKALQAERNPAILGDGDQDPTTSPHVQTSRLSIPTCAIGTIPFLPSPLATGIFLRQQSLRSAFHQNALTIGLSMSEIMLPSTLSPFYASLSTTASPCHIHTIPPDLRPTPSQTQFPHHPFIDLIPFSWFRDRVIVLGSLSPPTFDRLDLKRDILNGGMICWKGRGRGDGMPWDRRSWEMEAWFMRKWGWLVDEGGQVEGRSVWWRGLRGEQ